MSEPRILAIIPARGGSKGLPGKNVAPLAGKPLLLHSIEHALAVPSVDLVAVSTDDDAIAAVAEASGARVIRRPPELASDEAPSEGALLHVMERLGDEGYREPDLILFLQATSPLRRSDDVERAVECLLRERADSLFSASPQRGFVWRLRDHGVESITYDFHERKRRQDFDGETVVENGSFYLFKPWVIRRDGNRLGGVVTCCRMGFLETLEIDDRADLELAEWLLTAIRLHGWPSDRRDTEQGGEGMGTCGFEKRARTGGEIAQRRD